MKRVISMVLVYTMLLGVMFMFSPGTASGATVRMDRSRDRASIVEMARRLQPANFNVNTDFNTQFDEWVNNNPSEVTGNLLVDLEKFEEIYTLGSVGNAAFSQTPSLTAPHRAGSLRNELLNDAENAIKMVRYLAGLPYDDISLTNKLNTSAQHRAVIAAVTGEIGHNLQKPTDMSDTFYQAGMNDGYDQCELNHVSFSSNISMANTANAILGLVGDDGSNNISNAGHRIAILDPSIKEFGIGYVNDFSNPNPKNSIYGRTMYGNYYYVHTARSSGTADVADTYVAWPNSGYFPIDYFSNPSYPWTLTLGADYQAPNKNNISLILTRTRGNKTWIFDEATPNLGENNANYMNRSLNHFNISGKTITFRPNLNDLGTINDGDIFEVNLFGIRKSNGAETMLTYSIEFFDLEKEMGGSGNMLFPTEVSDFTPAPDEIRIDKDMMWKDTYLAQNSKIYNHDFATIAAKLSCDAYKKEDIEDTLKNLKFYDFDPHNYPVNPNDKDTVGYSFARKKRNMNGRDYNIITVVIRGTPANREWYGNFDIGYSDVHKGFETAKDKLLTTLGYYLQAKGLADPTYNKILITGHSRGAAVANLLAADLIDSEKFCFSENLFTYTFATPNVTTKSKSIISGSTYGNIFNFVHAEDFVPYLPLSTNDWGFWKYGKTFVFPSKDLGSYGFFEPLLTEKWGKKYDGYKNGFTDVQNLVRNMNNLANDVFAYYNIPHKAGLDEITAKEYFDIVCAVQANTAEKDASIKKLFALSTLPNKYGALSKFFVINSGNIPLINPKIRDAHDETLYLAWMKITDANSLLSKEDISYKLSGKYIRIACPVDIEVYNSRGILVGKVVDNVVDGSIGNGIGIFVDDDVKNIFVPSNDSYTIRMNGTDIGTMDYIVSEFDIIDGNVSSEVVYKNVPLTNSIKYSGEVNGEANTSPSNYNLTADDGTIIPYSYVTDASGNVTDEIIGRTNSPIPFTDVYQNEWFYDTVSRVYSEGLMLGTSATTFNPYGNITIAQAITMAARAHAGSDSAVGGSGGGNWYDTYVDYAMRNGIIRSYDFSNYDNALATRAQMAYIFSNVIPANKRAATSNKVPPDVRESDEYGQEIYLLYRTGILMGNDDAGTFNSDSNITRAEAAAIILRVYLLPEGNTTQSNNINPTPTTRTLYALWE